MLRHLRKPVLLQIYLLFIGKKIDQFVMTSLGVKCHLSKLLLKSCLEIYEVFLYGNQYGPAFLQYYWLRLRLHGAIYCPNCFVLMLCYHANLKATRYESTCLNRIVADKSHRVIVAQ